MDIILGIESSCDDTAAAVCIDGKIVSNVIHSQIIHTNYGGVVPELASRDHEKNIIPVVREALLRADIDKSSISAIACTKGPGLIGSLLVGVCFSKAMALALDIPIIEVHHIQAHIHSALIENPEIEYPFMTLVVSGGHTQLVYVKSLFDMKVIGTTIDDAAGEAFDKAAKLMGLPYPGGPNIDKLARSGNPNAFQFARPKVCEYDFSFSGLKTSIMYFIQKEVKANPNFIEENKNDLAASIQYTIISILMDRLREVLAKYPTKAITVVGGVSANSGLRKAVSEVAEENNIPVYIPKMEYCTDNASMIALSGYYKFLEEKFSDQTLEPQVKNYTF